MVIKKFVGVSVSSFEAEIDADALIQAINAKLADFEQELTAQDGQIITQGDLVVAAGDGMLHGFVTLEVITADPVQ